jgi:hypothetical protein
MSEGDRMQAECMSLYDINNGTHNFIWFNNICMKSLVTDQILEWKEQLFSTVNLNQNFKVVSNYCSLVRYNDKFSFSVSSSALESCKDW